MANFVQGWPTLKRLFKYGLLWKKKIILACIMLFISSISEILGPVLISYFINTILTKHRLNKKIILIIFLAYFLLQIISIILNYFQMLLFNKTAIQIVQQIRSEIISATVLQPIHFFNKKPIGKIVSTITNDTEVIKLLYDTVLNTILKSSSLISIMLITMFILQWKMAITAIILFPLIILVILLYQHYSTPILRKMRSYLAKINHEFNECINGIFVIQQFLQEKRFQKSIEYTSQLHYQTKMQFLKLDSILLRPLISFFSSLILCSLMTLFVTSPIGTLTIGTLYAFISYLNRINEPLITIATQQSILQQAVVAGERIFKIIDKKKQTYGNDMLPLKTGNIKISNLNFKYCEKSKNILNNINLSITSKSMISIVGETGSGKSTLTHLLMNYYSILEGKILIDNRSINSLSYTVLRKGISIVQQEPTIFTGTILSNITLGKKIPVIKIWKILKSIKLDIFIQSLPNKLDTKLIEQGSNLSIGQKQLLSIARVLLLKPKILILDEATANIDSETEQIIQKAFLKLKKYSTLIIIAHRLSTIIQSDQIIVLKSGTIVEKGNHKKLIQKKGLYYNMYKTK